MSLTSYKPLIINSLVLTGDDLLREEVRQDIRTKYNEIIFKDGLQFTLCHKTLARIVATSGGDDCGVHIRQLFAKLGPVCCVIANPESNMAVLALQVNTFHGPRLLAIQFAGWLWDPIKFRLVWWSYEDGVSFARAARIPIVHTESKLLMDQTIICSILCGYKKFYEYIKSLIEFPDIDLNYFAFPLLYNCGYRVRKPGFIYPSTMRLTHVTKSWALISIRPDEKRYGPQLSFCRPA